MLFEPSLLPLRLRFPLGQHLLFGRVAVREVERHVVTTRDGLPETGIGQPLNPLRRTVLGSDLRRDEPVKQMLRHVDTAPVVESHGCRAGPDNRRVIVKVVVRLKAGHSRCPVSLMGVQNSGEP